MKAEMKDASELEWERFKMNMVANHPSQAKEILDLLDKQKEPLAPEIPVSEEGFDAQETSFIIDELRRLGFAVT